MQTKGRLIVISGPSGAGKSTIVFKAIEGRDDMCFSTSVTSRKARPGEVDGREYFFIDRERFQQMIDNDDDSDGSDEGASAAGNPTSSQGESEGTDEAATSTDNEGDATQTSSGSSNASKVTVTEDGWYTSKEEVALYIHTYGRLPGNFISKTKARKAGWVAKEGNLDEVCPGMSIGGSVYYNEGWDGEELLPEAKGRTWTECDINYHGGYRGAERLVFSNDGLIFYTDDHYQTFEQLY